MTDDTGSGRAVLETGQALTRGVAWLQDAIDRRVLIGDTEVVFLEVGVARQIRDRLVSLECDRALSEGAG